MLLPLQGDREMPDLPQGVALGYELAGLSGRLFVTPIAQIKVTIYTMPQSLCKIYLHIVFHIKTTSPEIDEEHLERLHNYIGQLVNSTGCKVIRVGGTSDHVHIICLLAKDETVSHLVEEMKRNSSRWIKTLSTRYTAFAWQSGYAAFSVSQSVIEKTIEYVNNKKLHHQKLSFHDEYIQFLKLYHIEYDERYVLRD